MISSRKIFICVLFSFFFLALVLPSASLALTPKELEERINQILPFSDEIIGREGTPRAGQIKLPGGRGESFRGQIIPASISILLGLAGSIAFIVFTVAGIMLIVSQGNEELHTKVKNIFVYAAIGLTLITLSYAIIYGVFTLRFDEGAI